MKKFFATLICLTLLIGAFGTANAAPAETRLTINEYDVYLQIKQGVNGRASDSTTLMVQTGYVENELLRRSTLSNDALIRMGYSPKQIEILKTYDGSPIENHPELRGVFADLYVTFEKYSASKSSIGVKIDWEWSNLPALHGLAVYETIGIAWEGTSMESTPMNLKANTSMSRSKVNYVYSNDFSRHYKAESHSFSVEQIHGFVQDRFTSGLGEYNTYFAQSGTATLVVIPEAPGNSIYSASFVVTYAHFANGLSLSLGAGYGPFSIGIDVPMGGHNMYTAGMTVTNSGSVERY